MLCKRVGATASPPISNGRSRKRKRLRLYWGVYIRECAEFSALGFFAEESDSIGKVAEWLKAADCKVRI